MTWCRNKFGGEEGGTKSKKSNSGAAATVLPSRPTIEMLSFRAVQNCPQIGTT